MEAFFIDMDEDFTLGLRIRVESSSSALGGEHWADYDIYSQSQDSVNRQLPKSELPSPLDKDVK